MSSIVAGIFSSAVPRHALVLALDPQSRSKLRAPQHYVNVSLPPPHSSSDPHLRANLKPHRPSEIGNRVF